MPDKTDIDGNGADSSTAVEDGNLEKGLMDVTEQFASALSSSQSSSEEQEKEEDDQSSGRNSTQTEKEPQKEESKEEDKTEEVEPSTEDEEKTSEDQEEQSTDEEQETEQDKAKREQAIPRQRFDEVNNKLRQYEPLAQRMVRLESWCQEKQIGPKDFEQALMTYSLKRTNPQEYVNRLKAEIDTIEVGSGSRLPKDLAEEVEAGTLSEARAKELAQLRIKSSGAESMVKQTAEDAQAAYINSMSTTLNQWATGKMQTDPDFLPKKDANAADGKFEDFLIRFQAMTASRIPQNYSELIQLAEQALDQTNAMIKRFQPKPAKKKVLKNDGSSTAKNNGQPKNYDEVVDLVASKHGFK